MCPDQLREHITIWKQLIVRQTLSLFSSLILVFKNSYIRLIMSQGYFYKVVINTVWRTKPWKKDEVTPFSVTTQCYL